ncbi:M13 family peptidase, partial [Francisella tularensis]|nr:M13 family peptidase [Francisella tularensis]
MKNFVMLSLMCLTKYSRINYIDGSINEKDDFYRYVNGKWLDNVSIPADENSWGSFMELRKNVLFQQHEVIDELNSQDIEAQTNRQRVYGLYQSYMNLVIINKLGLKPLANYFESINSIEDNKQLVDFFAKLNKIGSETPLKLSINIDAKNSSQMIVSISQGSLGLPNDYLEYIIKLLQQVNIKNPEEAAQKILSLETLLAEIQFSEVENRDPDKIYNKFKVSNLNDLYPYIEWNSYLKSAEIPETEKFIIIKQLRYII